MINTEVKVLAFYLPQFHCIPENDLFWGKDFTDWVTVKHAQPLFQGHVQPKVPFEGNYYDLSQKDVINWQTKIAKEYGIYGFGIYHYWFNNEKNLLTKPARIILENKDVDINYFFAWDNASWKRSWSNIKDGNDWAPIMENDEKKGNEPSILVPYIIGKEEDWRNHYQYLLDFFKDSRYIKKSGKPIFMILHYSIEISEMCRKWNQWALEDGFNGMLFIFKYDIREKVPKGEFVYKYEPNFSGWLSHSNLEKLCNKFKRLIVNGKTPRILNYDEVWEKILRNAQNTKKTYIFHGGFVSYDDSPRRGEKGTVIDGATPEKFKKYFSRLVEISKRQNKEFVFLTAWNEWGEGAYLEPDNKTKYDYLECVKDVLMEKRNSDI